MTLPVRLKVGRRQLLTTAAAMTAASVVPIPKPTEGAQIVDLVKSATASSEASAKVSAATGRRLLEIARRNELRSAFDLPALSVPKELRRMKRAEDEQEFEQFAASRRPAVGDQVLQHRRAAEADPNWRPGFMEGMAYQAEVDRLLRKRFRSEP
jgi:hypothetical protein